MNIVILLVLSSVLAAAAFLIAFLWAAGSGQYDDVYTPAVRMLFDDTIISTEKIPIELNDHGT